MEVEAPNVVLFVVDDMGWTDWEKRSDFYETPSMTRLANRGVTFTQAYASASICSPTRASLMTGLSPALHGMTKWVPGNPANRITHEDEPESVWNLDAGHVTIAEAMKRGGYHTAHIGKWHLGEKGEPAADPTNHGFDVNIGGNHRGQPPSYQNRNSYLQLPGMDSGIEENFLTDHLGKEASNYIKSRVDRGEKFFLNFDLYGVHTPIQAHPDYEDYFQNKQAGTIHDNASYASMIKAMDDALGQVLDTLEVQGVSDETVIIFTSDNGGLTSPGITSNAPLRGGKGQQWEGGHRVPMIIAGPGIDQGIETAHQAISHDLYPTILELSGVPGDADHNNLVEGLSLAGVLRGSDTDGRGEALFWHFPHKSNHAGGPYGAIVLGDWKFIENYETSEQYLFNLSNDLGESQNLVESEAAKADSLRLELHNYLREVDAPLWNGFELVPEPSSGLLLLPAFTLAMRRLR